MMLIMRGDRPPPESSDLHRKVNMVPVEVKVRGDRHLLIPHLLRLSRNSLFNRGLGGFSKSIIFKHLSF